MVSDTGKRKNRKQRRASGIYRLEPLFRDPETRSLMSKGATHTIDGKLGEYLVVSVPETTTRASAADLERELSKLAKQPVLVVTHNMAFFRAKLLTGKEEAELGKIIEKAETPPPTPPSDGTPFGKGN